METSNHKFELEIKSLGKNGLFTGYASVFGHIDNQNDLILPGAFMDSLDNLGQGKDIKLLWQHDVAEPIGVFDEIREDEIGLFVQGRLLLEVEKAREAYSLLKNGALRGLSIGYNVVESDIDLDNGIRMISDLDLHEISLVTFPANELAQIAEVKSDDMLDCTGYQEIELNDALDRLLYSMEDL